MRIDEVCVYDQGGVAVVVAAAEARPGLAEPSSRFPRN